jgi:DNA-binding response OmpR family regulator
MAKILLVDKDAVFSTSLSRSLRKAGHEIDLASTGDEAMLELATTRPFDLVITDLLAPELDGFDLIVTVTETRPRTPILALYRRHPQDNFDQALIARALGASLTIEKPVKPGVIVDIVTTLFRTVPAQFG